MDCAGSSLYKTGQYDGVINQRVAPAVTALKELTKQLVGQVHNSARESSSVSMAAMSLHQPRCQNILASPVVWVERECNYEGGITADDMSLEAMFDSWNAVDGAQSTKIDEPLCRVRRYAEVSQASLTSNNRCGSRPVARVLFSWDWQDIDVGCDVREVDAEGVRGNAAFNQIASDLDITRDPDEEIVTATQMVVEKNPGPGRRKGQKKQGGVKDGAPGTSKSFDVADENQHANRVGRNGDPQAGQDRHKGKSADSGKTQNHGNKPKGANKGGANSVKDLARQVNNFHLTRVYESMVAKEFSSDVALQKANEWIEPTLVVSILPLQ